MLDGSIISTAIPSITNEFHSVSDIGWYGAAYQLANASMQPMAGKLYTYFPPKITFLLFFAVFELGSLVCGLARSSTMLILGRAVAGLGSSGLTSGVLAMVTASMPLAKRPWAIGVGIGISQVGLVAGFLINLPAGFIFTLPLLFLRIPSRHHKLDTQSAFSFLFHKLDIVGFMLLAPAATMLLLALQYGATCYSWDSPIVVGLFCGATVAFIVFLWDGSTKGEDALLPMWMISRRVVWCSCLVMVFSVATTYCASYFLPIYFQTVRDISPIMSGVWLLPTILSQLLAAAVSGILVSKTGYYLPWSPIIALQNFLPEKDIAVGTAFIMFGHTMGGAIFISLAQTIFIGGLRVLIPIYAPGIDPNLIIGGESGLRSAPSGTMPEMAGILVAITKSINRVFYMTAGAGAAAFIFAWGIGWRDIRKVAESRRASLVGEEAQLEKIESHTRRVSIAAMV
ncbi:hypothetical protein OQA88_13388 [Cercophora sp. LCS_1]